ncbi:MAG: hypothetical protein HN350_20765 [Phycisphaerales bacterium]|nr:hypothetical protein [Phycisphaerales bacterium]
MFKNFNNRGSVLLMVIGLMVILGTLGGTFLLISSLDARQSKLLAGRGKAELIASGGVGQVVRLLGEDLYIAPSAASPYTLNDVLTNYSDYRGNGQDIHIFSTDGGVQPSNILGEGTKKLTSTEVDGGTGDSYLVGTGEYNEKGQQFYIAIKTVDLSSMLALNSAGYDYLEGKTDKERIAKTPALIDLGSIYDNIHKARCDNTTKTIETYDMQCGRYPMNPGVEQAGGTYINNDFTPFSVADEVYLRWRGSGRKANYGRVYSTLGANGDKSILTTLNASRSIARKPLTDMVAARLDLSEIDILDDESQRQNLYSSIVMIAGSDNGAGGGLRSDPPTIKDSISSHGVFKRSSKQWKATSSMSGAMGANCYRYPGQAKKAWWVFTDMPPATYEVRTSWGQSATLKASTAVKYVIYAGGTLSGGSSSASYSGGKVVGTRVFDQTVEPPTSIDGQKWASLGRYSFSGPFAIEINGPQFPPAEGEPAVHSFADAIRLEGIGTDLGEGSLHAAHLTANLWAAMTEDDDDHENLAFPFKPEEKDYTVYGMRGQPFITEAFATHTTNTISQPADVGGVEQPETIDTESWKWGIAIEIMNFTDREIDLANYRLVFSAELDETSTLVEFPANSKITANGGRLVFYDFDAGKDTVKAADVFGANYKASWKEFTPAAGAEKQLTFDNSNKTIRLVQLAKEKMPSDGGAVVVGAEHRIPIDHITAGLEKDLLYTGTSKEVRTMSPPDAVPGKSLSETVSANCRRDDDKNRERYAVAIYGTPRDEQKKTNITPYNVAPKPPNAVTATSHKLGLPNSVGLTGTIKIPEATLKEGFRMNIQHGLLNGPGDLTNLYIAGPVRYDKSEDAAVVNLPADLPELLKEFATAESRGRANSHAKNMSQANFTQDPWNRYPRTRGGVDIAWPLLFGEVIETVPTDVRRGDCPGRVYGRINVNTASSEVLQRLPWPTGVNAATAAGKIIAYRTSKGGFVTPGEVTLALDGFVQEGVASTQGLDRDSVYAAISGCITVNSDMYAVTVKVQLGDDPAEKINSWHYVAVIDRSCVTEAKDKPAVLLFAQVK